MVKRTQTLIPANIYIHSENAKYNPRKYLWVYSISLATIHSEYLGLYNNSAQQELRFKFCLLEINLTNSDVSDQSLTTRGRAGDFGEMFKKKIDEPFLLNMFSFFLDPSFFRGTKLVIQ